MPSGLTFGFHEYGVRTLLKNLDSFYLYRIIYRFLRYITYGWGHLSMAIICLWWCRSVATGCVQRRPTHVAHYSILFLGANYVIRKFKTRRYSLLVYNLYYISIKHLQADFRRKEMSFHVKSGDIKWYV